ncbi:formate dehydrogenase accessory sulfurtransferase FdhD [Reyranella sp.]|uniref:formate dehydrogenase accessory sulfurtransferase FdhD n=1 Tax=Reyranella sp. TaxID=1929291 RepID=UPI002F92EC0D
MDSIADRGSIHLPAHRLTASGDEALDEIVAEEVAVALVYNGVSHAVMMATPGDLEDLARGFSLTEGIVDKPADIYDIEVEPAGRGIEVRIEIASARLAALRARRRNLGGRTGCGLCGIESLDAALRTVPPVRAPGAVSRAAIARAMAALPPAQRLNRENGATHAAAWAASDGALVAVREDVGRHNALDKLAGALAKSGEAKPGGFVVVTSRCSYEMVQKAAAIGAAAIAAVSAPTSLAIATAEQAGLALVAFVRDGRLTVYAHAERIAA